MKHTTNKFARFFAILKQVNAQGANLTKEQAVANFTNGRTTSLSALAPHELGALEDSLSALANGGNAAQPVAHPKDTRDNMRKAIISQFKSIAPPDAYSQRAAVYKAKAWAEKHGPGKGIKRKFNDYTEQELYILIANAEKMKEETIYNATKPI